MNHGYPHQAPKKKLNGCVIAVLGGLAALALLGGCVALVSSGGTDTVTVDQPGAATGGKSAAPKKAPGIGDTVKDGKFAFKVTKTSTEDSVGNEFLNKRAQGRFLLVHVTVKNIGDEAQSFAGSAQKLYDNKGREFEASGEAALYLDDSKSLYESINPGNAVNGIVLFDLPKGAKATEIELHDSMFSDGVRVKLS